MLWRGLIVLFGLICSGCPTVWDCTQQSEEMAEWVKDCRSREWFNTCQTAAVQIFCQPVNELKEK